MNYILHNFQVEFYLINTNSRFSIILQTTIESKVFEGVILFFIIASSIHLVLDNPLIDPNGSYQYVLNIIDIAITAIFVLEFLLKVISYGFWFNGKKSYLRNYWNVLDFIIVIFSVKFPKLYLQVLSLMQVVLNTPSLVLCIYGCPSLTGIKYSIKQGIKQVFNWYLITIKYGIKYTIILTHVLTRV